MYHPLRRRQLHFLSYTAGIEPTLPKENEATPEEALDLAYKDLRDDLATQLLAQIKSSHPSFFEKLVVDLMLKMGYGGPGDDAGTVTSYGHDSGIDGVINEDTLACQEGRVSYNK